jgi:hypothetical protein
MTAAKLRTPNDMNEATDSQPATDQPHGLAASSLFATVSTGDSGLAAPDWHTELNNIKAAHEEEMRQAVARLVPPELSHQEIPSRRLPENAAAHARSILLEEVNLYPELLIYGWSWDKGQLVYRAVPTSDPTLEAIAGQCICDQTRRLLKHWAWTHTLVAVEDLPPRVHFQGEIYTPQKTTAVHRPPQMEDGTPPFCHQTAECAEMPPVVSENGDRVVALSVGVLANDSDQATASTRRC